MKILTTDFRPSHSENRMRHEGDVENARKLFLKNANPNLRFLLEKRYQWMNDFIDDSMSGIEVGGGTGISKFFIKCKKYQVTDFSNFKWLDVKNVDALATPFKSKSYDFVISSNMIHHVPYPKKFFREMHRILKQNGLLIIQEINASLIMRAILHIMKHEGYSFNAKVFDIRSICTDPDDLWSANCAIPNLLFDNPDLFHRHIKEFKIVHQSYSECISFLNSGGVIAKTAYIPLPTIFLKGIWMVDSLLAKSLPNIFALQRQIVLKKYYEN